MTEAPATILFVRNTQPGPTVFTDPLTKVAFEWAAKDDPGGEDVQQIPSTLMSNGAFVKAVQRGIFVVENPSEEIDAILARQTTTFQERQQAASEAARAVIQHEAQEDYIQVACIGPNNKGTGECGDPVAVKEKHRSAKPPLCVRHRALVGQYVITETDQITDGKAVQVWKRMPMGHRETDVPSPVPAPTG